MGFKLFSLALALAAVPAPSARAAAVSRLEVVEVGADEVTLHVTSKVELNTFLVETPDRLVIELMDTEFAAAERQVKGAGEYLKGVRSNQFQSRPRKVVRVVLDLTKPIPFQARWEENRFRVSLATGVPVPPPAPPPAPEPASPPAQASGVDLPGYRLPEKPNDFALVFGIEKYSEVSDAKFAERDAQAVQTHLQALGVPGRHIMAVFGSKAVRSSLEKYVETWLPSVAVGDSRVFFYFAGHGSMDPKTGQAVLLPWDGDPEYLGNTGYPLERLCEKLGSLKAKEIVVAVDAGFFGAGERMVVPPQASGVKPAEPDIPKRVIVFAAASGEQGAGVLEGQGHGLFTYYFLKGVGGDAQNASGTVTAKGLQDYLKPKVQEAARLQGRDQVPALQTRKDVDLARF